MPRARAITITLEPGHTIDVKEGLTLPAGSSVDIAILRAVAQEISLIPITLSLGLLGSRPWARTLSSAGLVMV